MSQAVRVLDRPEPPGEQSPPGRSAAGLVRAVLSRAGRWALRGMALLYLGLLVVVPAAAVIAKGFGHGTGALRQALAVQGGTSAVVLTLEMSAVAAVINGTFGTLLA